MLNALATGAAGLVGPLLGELANMGSKAVVGYVGRRLGELSGDSSTPETLSNVTERTVDTLGNSIDLERRVKNIERTVRKLSRSISPGRKRVVQAPVINTMMDENENELGFE